MDNVHAGKRPQFDTTAEQNNKSCVANGQQSPQTEIWLPTTVSAAVSHSWYSSQDAQCVLTATAFLPPVGYILLTAFRADSMGSTLHAAQHAPAEYLGAEALPTTLLMLMLPDEQGQMFVYPSTVAAAAGMREDVV